MAKPRIWEADVKLEISLTLNEAETRALHALTAYGTDAFLKTFYEHMGQSCLKPHENGLRELFATVRGEVSQMLRRADTAREAFKPKPADTQHKGTE